MSTTGWLTGLRVTADGTGIVSHAGVALADNIGRWDRINALPQAPDQHQAVPAIKEEALRARGTPATRPASRATDNPETPKQSPQTAHRTSPAPRRPRRESSRLEENPPMDVKSSTHAKSPSGACGGAFPVGL
jgi:hypothetical protein